MELTLPNKRPPVFPLPETGEARIDARAFAAALGVSMPRFFVLAKSDPKFPAPIERRKRYTRWLLSHARAYVTCEVTQ